MNNGWIRTRMSSEDKRAFNKLNENNHIFSIKERVLEIYGVPVGEGGKPYGQEDIFTGWADDKMLGNSNGYPLDIIVHIKLDEENKPLLLVWEPFVEYISRKDIFERQDVISSYDFGYIAGRKSPFDINKMESFGKINGYTRFSKINSKAIPSPTEPLKQEMNIESRENK